MQKYKNFVFYRCFFSKIILPRVFLHITDFIGH